MSERLARLATIALCALPLVAYLPRLLHEPDTLPAQPPPRWAHLVVVTAERCSPWPTLEREAFAELEARSTRPLQTLSTSTVPAAAAATLWTGRFPHHHGVLAPTRALAPGSWTLATALARSGARTAAFLASPFATTTGIEGFELVVEDADAGAAELAGQAAAFVRAAACDATGAQAPQLAQRLALWVHVRDAGPGGRELAHALAVVREALAEVDALDDCVTLVTALGGEPGARGERRYDVPLWLELPTALFAGRRAPGVVGLVDFAAPLIEVLGLAGPDPLAGQAPVQSREEIATALAGGPLRKPFLLHEPGRHRWLDGPWRVEGPDPPPADGPGLRISHAQLGSSAPTEEANAAAQRYAQHVASLTARAETGRAVAVPAAWHGVAGW